MTHRTQFRRGERGFTLVEFMISIAIGMVVALALLTLLINVNRNQAELARTNSVIENGRFSLQLLEADVSHAGFWGGYVPTFDNLNWSGAVGTANTSTVVALPSAVPDPCAATSTWDADYNARLIGLPVQVYQVSSTGTSPVCSGFITSSVVQPSTDVLVVRHAAPCAATASGSDSDCQYSATSGDLYFQFSRCATDAAAYVLTSTVASLALKAGDCATVAPVYKFVSTVYWVRNYSVTPGDQIPTLVRTRFQPATSGGVTTLAHQSTEPIVEGIQSFRAELGVDNVSKASVAGGTGNTLTAANFAAAVAWATSTAYYTPVNRGDGNADNYVVCSTDTGGAGGTSRCADPFYLANTVALKLHVLVRALTPTPGLNDTKKYTIAGTALGPFNDGFKRHVYTQTVRLTNVSMRREVPSAL